MRDGLATLKVIIAGWQLAKRHMVAFLVVNRCILSSKITTYLNTAIGLPIFKQNLAILKFAL